MMKILCRHALVVAIVVSGLGVKAQSDAILEAPPGRRLPLFWLYCLQTNISDQDSTAAHTFFNEIISGANRLGDRQLKAYAQYFQKGWRIFFTPEPEQHFGGNYLAIINLLSHTQVWAVEEGYADIAASCEHSIGEEYYRMARYGAAFEHLLKADAAFERLGYQRVPNASFYLYKLGLSFYQFEEYDKALQKLLEASRHEYYIPRGEINTLNTIGLIYARKGEAAKAIAFFKNTLSKAKESRDTAWIGIASGNIGNVWLTQQQYDSALYYHRINYAVNGNAGAQAPEDGAKSALSMATAFLHRQQPDSALHYMQSGEELASFSIKDSTETLNFQKRHLRLQIDYTKDKGDFQQALRLTDSLTLVEQKLTSILDGKILSRAIEKTEAVSYQNRLNLLKSQKDAAQFRLYFIIALLLLSLLVVVIIFRDKWLRRKRQMQLAEKDKQILLGEKQRAEDSLKHARELLNAYVDTIKEKTLLIEHLEADLSDIKNAQQAPDIYTLTGNREKLMRSTILTDHDWQQFRILFEQVYPGFPQRLRAAYPDLSPAESRFIFLARLNLLPKEMATMLGVSVDAVQKLRYRLRKKLHLEENSDFETVLQRIDEPTAKA